MSNTIPGTIVIGNPAQVVQTPDEYLDVTAIQAQNLASTTWRRFAYGKPDDPTAEGDPVVVEQGKYAFVLVGIADEPVTPEQFFQMSGIIAEALPTIRAVGTVRQDFVPAISDKYTATIDGELRLLYLQTPTTTTETEVAE